MAYPPENIEAIKPEIYTREEHPISRQDIDPDALKIMYRLLRNGFKAYLVGGGVRDVLLQKKPKDFDIATDATPRRIKALFSNSRIIGRRFKLVHVYFGGGKIIEVSTFRDFSAPIEQEDASDTNGVTLGPDNKYGSEVTDAFRRDLTINALFYDLATFSIIDYVGGIKDLSDKVIRIIGDPETRIKEDPVRMIRVIRHAAKASFSVERIAWDAILNLRSLIDECPAMRIYEEIKKDLVSGYFLRILRLLAQSELLEYLLPELLYDVPALFADDSFIVNSFRSVDELVRDEEEVSLVVTLALLALAMHQGEKKFNKKESLPFHSLEELEEYLRECFHKLAVPKKERERIEFLLKGWLYVMLKSDEDPGGRMRRVIDDAMLPDLLRLLEILGCDETLMRFAQRSAGARESMGDHRPRRRRRRGRGGRRHHAAHAGQEE